MDKQVGSERSWYAMSAPYRNELKAKRMLDELNAESFLPMCYRMVERDGIKKRRYLPAVSNLLFVRATAEELSILKHKIPVMQYKTVQEGGKHVKIIVPDRDMEQFIRVCEDNERKLQFLYPDEVNLEKGTKIRVIGGPLDGIEGYFLRVKGSRNRKLIINIENFLSVATEVSADMIEVLA